MVASEHLGPHGIIPGPMVCISMPAGSAVDRQKGSTGLNKRKVKVKAALDSFILWIPLIPFTYLTSLIPGLVWYQEFQNSRYYNPGSSPALT